MSIFQLITSCFSEAFYSEEILDPGNRYVLCVGSDTETWIEKIRELINDINTISIIAPTEEKDEKEAIPDKPRKYHLLNMNLMKDEEKAKALEIKNCVTMFFFNAKSADENLTKLLFAILADVKKFKIPLLVVLTDIEKRESKKMIELFHKKFKSDIPEDLNWKLVTYHTLTDGIDWLKN